MDNMPTPTHTPGHVFTPTPAANPASSSSATATVPPPVSAGAPTPPPVTIGGAPATPSLSYPMATPLRPLATPASPLATLSSSISGTTLPQTQTLRATTSQPATPAPRPFTASSPALPSAVSPTPSGSLGSTPAVAFTPSAPSSISLTPSLDRPGMPPTTPSLPNYGTGNTPPSIPLSGGLPLGQPKPRRSLRPLLTGAALLLAVGLIVTALVITLSRLGDNRANQQVGPTGAAGPTGALGPAASETETLSFNRDTVIAGGKTLTATGQVVLQNTIDSSLAFAIQDAEGSDLLTVDTLNGVVSIAGAPIAGGATLQVNGSISATNLELNGVTVCSINGCTPAAGSIPTISLDSIDAIALQGENAAFYTNASNLNAGTLADQRLSSNVALLDRDNQTFSGSNTFTDNVLIRPATDSATAFAVQDSGGASLLSLDTQSNYVVIGDGVTQTSDLELQWSTGTAFFNGSGAQIEVGNQPFIISTQGGSTNFTVQNNSVSIFAETTISGGDVTIRSSTDSATAFQVQDAGGEPMLTVDTTNQGVYLQNVLGGSSFQMGDLGKYVSLDPICVGPFVGTLAECKSISVSDDSGNFNTFAIDASDGAAIFRNSFDAENAFQVQNAAGSNLLKIDTDVNRVFVGLSSGLVVHSDSTVEAAGDLTVQGASNLNTVVAMGGLQVGDSDTFTNSSVYGFIEQTTSGVGADAFHVNVANGDNGIVLQSPSSVSVALGVWDQTAPDAVFLLDFAGHLILQNSVNASTAFAIQNADATSILLLADTVTSQILFPSATSSATAILIGGDASLYRYGANVLGTNSGFLGGRFTTTQRDAIPSGSRPTGMMIFNTTTNRYEYNAGTEGSPNWLPFNRQVEYSLAQWPPANPSQGQVVVLADTYNGKSFKWVLTYRPDLNATYPWDASTTNAYVINHVTALDSHSAGSHTYNSMWNVPLAGDYQAITWWQGIAGQPTDNGTRIVCMGPTKNSTVAVATTCTTPSGAGAFWGLATAHDSPNLVSGLSAGQTIQSDRYNEPGNDALTTGHGYGMGIKPRRLSN
jgi:hypothetical protein